MKSSEGWINGYTPPPGFVLDDRGFATPSNNIIAAVQRTIGATQTFDSNRSHAIVPLPPPAATDVPVPPIIETNPNRAGASFGRAGSRTRGDDQSSVSMVSINGRAYNGHVYDARGNRIS